MENHIHLTIQEMLINVTDIYQKHVKTENNLTTTSFLIKSIHQKKKENLPSLEPTDQLKVMKVYKQFQVFFPILLMLV